MVKVSSRRVWLTKTQANNNNKDKGPFFVNKSPLAKNEKRSMGSTQST